MFVPYVSQSFYKPIVRFILVVLLKHQIHRYKDFIFLGHFVFKQSKEITKINSQKSNLLNKFTFTTYKIIFLGLDPLILNIGTSYWQFV